MRFRLLGTLEICDDAGVPVPVRSARDRVVLATLLLNAGRTVTHDRLAEAAWDGDPPRTARDQLYTCLSRLRRLIGHAILVTEPSGYRVTISDDDLDAAVFVRLVSQARAASAKGDLATAIARYREAEHLWRGPAIDDVPSVALRRHVVGLDELRLGAREECLDLELRTGTAAAMVPELARLVELHPFRERLHGCLMRALWWEGRQAEAHAVYQRLYRRLHDELAVEPSPAVAALHRRILNGEEDPVQATPVMSGAVSRQPDAAPGPPPPPQNLPGDVAGFAGRLAEVDHLDSLLRAAGTTPSGPPVVVVISGTAGVGKTALAVHWANRVTDQFPDGQLYLDLRGSATQPPMRALEALTTLLQSLGVAGSQIPNDTESTAALYRSRLRGRRVLILLDNAGSEQQVRPLLPATAGCAAIITSRDRLGGLVAHNGAHRIRLDVLPPNDAHTLLINTLGVARVDVDQPAAAELSALCAYLPLALRIAAANLADHPRRTIAAYVGELAEGNPVTDLHNDGDEDMAVQTAFDLSYQALPAEARRLFRLLGLVPGPDVTAAAAAALAAVEPDVARRCLERLARAHLLDEHLSGRFTFHDLLRTYARHLALREDGDLERQQADLRLMDWYLAAADSAAAALYPHTLRLPGGPHTATTIQSRLEFSGPAQAREWLDAERPNLVAAIRHASEGAARPVAWQMAFRLRRYFWHNGHLADWAAVAQAALAATDEDDRRAQVTARLNLGDLHSVLSLHRDAIAHYQIARALASSDGWAAAEAAGLGAIGSCHLLLGQLAEAEQVLSRRLALARRDGTPGMVAATTGNLANVYREQGRLRRSLRCHRQALDLYQQAGVSPEIAGALSNLGDLAHLLGRLDEARVLLAQAVALAREVGDRFAEINSMLGQAAVEVDTGHGQTALETATEAMALADLTGSPLVRVRARNVLGRAYRNFGQADTAVDHHLAALHIAEQCENPGYQAESLARLADAYRAAKNGAAAAVHAERAVTLAGECGYHLPRCTALTLLAELRLDEGDHAGARDRAQLALAGHRASGHRLGQARALAALARACHGAGETTAARRHRRAALHLYTAVGARIPEDLLPHLTPP